MGGSKSKDMMTLKSGKQFDLNVLPENVRGEVKYVLDSNGGHDKKAKHILLDLNGFPIEEEDPAADLGSMTLLDLLMENQQ